MTYQPVTYTRDVLALMRDLGIERAVFLGTSMGGLITMALAAVKSKAIAAAIINDVGPQVSPVGLARIAAYAGQPVEISNWADAAAHVRKINEIAMPHFTDADWEAFARRTFRIGTEGTPVPDYDPDIMVPIRAAGPKALVPNLWPFFTRLAKGRPTLLVRGGTSDLLSPEIAAKMRKRAPKMDFVEVPGVGHAPMLDEPEAKAAIFPFLGELP
jgi:pimeloyl-ACP methyl ester carboxylesterase